MIFELRRFTRDGTDQLHRTEQNTTPQGYKGAPKPYSNY